jgi:hypothetical protein
VGGAGYERAIGAPVRRRYDLYEGVKNLAHWSYPLEEELKAMEPAETDRVVCWWLDELSKGRGAIGARGTVIAAGLWVGRVRVGRDDAWEARASKSRERQQLKV